MTKRYAPPDLKDKFLTKFLSRKQLSTEFVEQLPAELRELAIRAVPGYSPDQLDIWIKQRFIDGLDNRKLWILLHMGGSRGTILPPKISSG